MKETPLKAIHEKLGAKMVPFAGYSMPLKYRSISEEHLAVRQGAGLFDVSHMGEFIIKGKEATDLIQELISNDISSLEIGQAKYSCMLNENGGIIDDLLVYRLPENRSEEGERVYMMVVNAANTETDWNWIQDHNDYQADIENISDRTGLLALQGPRAQEILTPLTEVDVYEIPFYRSVKGQVAGQDRILISATGYTGSGGFELYGRNEQMEDIWEALIKAGSDYDLLPAGLGARDTLRLEMGYCLHGQDIRPDTHPFEAGLGWTVKMDKDGFIGQQALEKIKETGWTKKLTGFILEGRRVPREGYEILSEDGQRIGQVTSGSQSPSLEKPIGMGYIEKEYAKAGNAIGIQMGNKVMRAKIVRIPFYNKSMDGEEN